MTLRIEYRQIQGSTEISQSAAQIRRLTYQSQASNAVFGLAPGRSDKIDSRRTHLRQSTNQDCAPSWVLVPFFFLLRFRSSWLSSSLPSLSLSPPLPPHHTSLHFTPVPYIMAGRSSNDNARKLESGQSAPASKSAGTGLHPAFYIAWVVS